MSELAVAGTIEGSRYLETRQEITRLFRLLRDQRAQMTIQISGAGGKTYTARVLDVDTDAFLLDDVHPRAGHAELTEGQTFTLMGRTDGVYLFITDNRIAASRSERGLSYFEIPLPNRVLYQQRRHGGGIRSSLRVSVNDGVLAITADNNSVTGHIVDISAGGCRVDMEATSVDWLDIDMTFEQCSIHIPHVLDINAEVAVRYFNFNKRRNLVACGLEFTRMNVTDRRRLERLVQTIARTARA